MDLSVNPSQVKQFASQLKQWASQMKQTQQNIQSRVRSLESSWKDPQYRMFVETTKNHGESLRLSIEQFETMSQELAALARELEEAKRRAQQRINRMGR